MGKSIPWKINPKSVAGTIFGSVQPKTRYRLRGEMIIPDGRVSGICSRSIIKRPYGCAMRPNCIRTSTWTARFAMCAPGTPGMMRRLLKGIRMYRKPYWGCTVKLYFGAFSIAIDPAMPVLGGLGIRFNFRIYGKRYWQFKRKMESLRKRHAAA